MEFPETRKLGVGLGQELAWETDGEFVCDMLSLHSVDVETRVGKSPGTRRRKPRLRVLQELKRIWPGMRQGGSTGGERGALRCAFSEHRKPGSWEGEKEDQLLLKTV